MRGNEGGTGSLRRGRASTKKRAPLKHPSTRRDSATHTSACVHQSRDFYTPPRNTDPSAGCLTPQPTSFYLPNDPRHFVHLSLCSLVPLGSFLKDFLPWGTDHWFSLMNNLEPWVETPWALCASIIRSALSQIPTYLLPLRGTLATPVTLHPLVASRDKQLEMSHFKRR